MPSSSITWGGGSGKGPRITALSPKKVITPTYLNGLGGKTAFELTPVDTEEPLMAEQVDIINSGQS